MASGDSSRRKDRLERLVRDVIADTLVMGMADPRFECGMLTITRAELSNDYRYAKIFYLARGSEAEQRTLSRALADSCSYFQQCLADKKFLRNVPRLRFLEDEEVERGMRIGRLIDEIDVNLDSDDADETDDA